MVNLMRRACRTLMAMGFLGLPCGVWAEPSHPHPSPDSNPPTDIVLDDTSESKQTDVGRHVLGFLTTLQTHWGHSQDVLRHTLTGTIERDERGALIYSRRFEEYGIVEGYEFQDSGLMHGQYLFLERPVHDLNEFIEYYGAVKDALIDSFGVPTEDQTLWDNDVYQPLPEYWGIAVKLGHLRFIASWETADGTLSLELSGDRHSRIKVDYRRRPAGRLT